jgi:alpha-beta hydrolase superfamily lysophospholipase
VMPGFSLRKPTLILQGSDDAAVLQPMVDVFVGKLRAAGSPAITYRLFPGASHQNIVPRGTADTLAFLQTIFRQGY